jgi:Histidine kinase
MHPILRDPRRLALYLGSWGALGLLFASILRMMGVAKMSAATVLILPPMLLEGLICLTAWWVCRSAPLEKMSLLGAANRFFIASGQASAVWAGVATPWGVLMGKSGVVSLGAPQVLMGAGALFVIGLPLYAMSMAIHYLVLAFETAREAERRALESQVTAREAQLRALRAQLNPHFLFNSLNSINALVGADPEGARRMCESLGEFLRRTLALGARDSVTLEEELSLVDRYFAIERVRFGARLALQRTIESDAERCMVPPLLLQPLVENAVKHGIAERIEGGTIRIDAIVREGSLRLSVENEVDDDSDPRPGEGVGLENVRRRLDAVSARAARLDTVRANGTFRATLTLPARQAPASAEMSRA